MESSLAELETIVRNRICGVCSERNANGTCGLPDPAGCALFQLFPQVAQAILATDSPDIRNYIEAIRRGVCSVCAAQDSGGNCEVRREVRCALDSYLLLVVDTIEEATRKVFDPVPARTAGTVLRLEVN
jgi:hypothetical protein